LIIRSPWIEHIIEGRKTWEIRGKATTVCERIALIKGGSGRIVGAADLVDSVGPLTEAQLNERRDKHQVPPADLSPFIKKYGGKAHAWVLANVVKLNRPVPYTHPSGAVIWVTLPNGILDGAQ
jgi:hypothetical protein